MKALGLAVALFLGLAVVGVAGSVLGLIPDAVGLFFMPYRVHMETKIVTNSQGYVDAQDEMLRNLQSQYYSKDAGPEQKAAIVAQMHGLADRLHGSDLPDDIAGFLASH